MDHRIPLAGAVFSVIAVICAAATFIYLNEAFRGPSVTAVVSHPYELTATFDDVENLPTKTNVLSHGVAVGKVSSVDFNKDNVTGTATFTIDNEFRPIYKDATARIGERTILGDAFLDLDRGHPAAGELDSGSPVKALPSVDFDEAFDFLDKTGRAHLRSTLDTFGRGAKTPGNGARLNGTVGGLSRTIEMLNATTSSLQGQEQDIAALSSNASTVLGVLGDREAALREIVSSGRVTLDALASDTSSVEQGVHELPRLLDAGRHSLADARPLLVEARPLVRQLRAIAPDLRPALAGLGPLSRNAAGVVEGLKPFRVAAAPMLRKSQDLFRLALPVIDQLQPAVRNLVPLLGYLAPRANGIAAFFSNSMSAFAQSDSLGHAARFSGNIVPLETLGGASPGICTPEDDVPIPNPGVCSNAYPAPNDALNPEPYAPGSYPRLLPWNPPPKP
jgi:phospholipid/cholesterol/gamma-HCH transport system substrate-binding protein